MHAVSLVPPVFLGMGTNPSQPPTPTPWKLVGEVSGWGTCRACNQGALSISSLVQADVDSLLPLPISLFRSLAVGPSSALISCSLVSAQAHYRIEPTQTWAQGVDGPRNRLSGTCEWVYVFSPGNQELMGKRSTKHHLRYWHVSRRPVLQACQRR